MSKKNIKFDLEMIALLYKRNNDALLKLTNKSIENNNKEFKEYLINQKSVDYDMELLAEFSNIEWIFLNSIFLSLYTNFENTVYKLAKVVENKNLGEIKIDDIKGRGYIDQYRKFMFLIGKINSTKDSDLWNEIDVHKLVRNKLVHESGFLSQNTRIEEKKEFDYLIKNNVILAGKFGHIRIRDISFLKKFCELSSQLIDNLINDIKKI